MQACESGIHAHTKSNYFDKRTSLTRVETRLERSSASGALAMFSGHPSPQLAACASARRHSLTRWCSQLHLGATDRLVRAAA